MKKKSTRTLLSICGGLVLLAFLTLSAHAQEGVVVGRIRWPKDMGVIPAGPGNRQAAASPCGQFYVAAEDPDHDFKGVTVTDTPLKFSEWGDYYTCSYTLRVPQGKRLYIIAAMGGSLLLPQVNRDSWYIRDAWIGGSRSKPPAGAMRAFTGHRYVLLRGPGKRAIANFELLYTRSDDPR